MNTCATCRHWGKKGHHSGIPGLNECEKIPMLDGSTEWDRTASATVIKKKYSDVLAFAEDGSGYMAQLVTFAEFGCVMHKAKPGAIRSARPTAKSGE